MAFEPSPGLQARCSGAALGLLVGLMAGGCLHGSSSTRHSYRHHIPEPLLQPGSLLAYLKAEDDIHTSSRSIKGDSVGTETVRTHYTRMDLTTCQRGAGHAFEGASSELGWSRQRGGLWILSGTTARSLAGGEFALSLAGTRRMDLAGPLGAAITPDRVVLWHLDLATAWSVPLTAEDRVLEIRPASDDRSAVILITRPGVPGSPPSIHALRAPVGATTGAAAPPRVQLPTAGGEIRAARLTSNDTQVALVTRPVQGLGPTVAELFDLATGARLRQIPLPTDAWSLGDERAPWLLLATGDPQTRCARHLSVVDLERGSTRQVTLPFCAVSIRWLDGGFAAVSGFVGGSAAGVRQWAFDPTKLSMAGPMPTGGRDPIQLGDRLFFFAGPEGARHLVAFNLRTGQTGTATPTLGDIRFVVPEPSSGTLVVVTAEHTIFLLHARSGKLRRCRW